MSIDFSLKSPPASRDSEFALAFALLGAVARRSVRSRRAVRRLLGAPAFPRRAGDRRPPPEGLRAPRGRVRGGRLPAPERGLRGAAASRTSTSSPGSGARPRRGPGSSCRPASTGRRPGTTPRRASSRLPCAPACPASAADPRPRRPRRQLRPLVHQGLLGEPPLVVDVPAVEEPERLLLREGVDARDRAGRRGGRRAEAGRRDGQSEQASALPPPGGRRRAGAGERGAGRERSRAPSCSSS